MLRLKVSGLQRENRITALNIVYLTCLGVVLFKFKIQK